MTDQTTSRNIIIIGVILVVLAAVPYKMFDLARFFVPKELVLNAAAAALAVIGLRKTTIFNLTRVDLLLTLYLSLSLISALFAHDRWISTSAFTVTLSGAVIFWSARAAAKNGARDAIVAAVAAAGVLGAAVSLAQAYGLDCPLFSQHRIPGGTMGNRNFMAHLAAICAPALVLATLKAKRPWAVLCGALGIVIVADALVLSRTRAALLGLCSGSAVLAYAIWRTRGFRIAQPAAARFKILVLAAALGVLGALLIPNTLDWKSDSPYLDTVTGIANYQSGSGRGRMIQYMRTLRMSAANPLFGVGPGNWQLEYQKYSQYYDPSLDYSTGLTLNPWPSSDWIAILSERGLPALAAIILALFILLSGAYRKMTQPADTDDYLNGTALAAAIAITCTVACFDAVILLPASAFAVWALLGALAPELPAARTVTLSAQTHKKLVLTASIAATVIMLRGCAQLGALALADRARNQTRLSRAALFDPANLNIRLRLAYMRGRNHL